MYKLEKNHLMTEKFVFTFNYPSLLSISPKLDLS